MIRDLSQLHGRSVQASGHCRIDYTDPVTGRVLERIEGNNHVFTGQFQQSNWQGTAMYSHLLLTNGTAPLDPDLPWIPGLPVGYGAHDAASTSGVFRGAYRASASYQNKITRTNIKSAFVYDFLPTQIPDKIGYVGLVGSYGHYAGTAPFQYRWPVQSLSGIHDVERRLMITWSSSLPDTEGGDGSIAVTIRRLIPPESENSLYRTFQLFDLLGRPENVWPQRTYEKNGSTYNQDHSQTWVMRCGYDYENQRIVLYLTRCCRYVYRLSSNDNRHNQVEMKDDVWIVSPNLSTGEATLDAHYEHAWTAQTSDDSTSILSDDWRLYHPFSSSGSYAPSGMRFFDGYLYRFSTVRKFTTNEDRAAYRVIRYNVVSGEFSEETIEIGSNYRNAALNALQCYKGYCWGTSGICSISGELFTVVPMYDVFTNSLYSMQHCNGTMSSNEYPEQRFAEKGIVGVYPSLWSMKPKTNETDWASLNYWPSLPFAYTAYKIPSDAPERPANSAVTVSYELTVNW